jgi:sugar lactone lactonase YvrE
MVSEINNDTPQLLIPHSCELGECPVWDEARQRLLWLDILTGEIHQYLSATGEHRVFNTGQVTGSFALCTSGRVLVGFQNGFAFIDLETGTVEWLIEGEVTKPDTRFNDGKCDAAGRFWTGTMSQSRKSGAGSLYAIEVDKTIVIKIPGVTVSNGLAWSADDARFYFIDTATSQVAAYDYDIGSGSIANKKIAVNIPIEMGKPDGMTIDTEGMLWIALWNGWCVTRWNPYTCKLLQKVVLPVSQVTSCTFGGKELNSLYITTANTGLSDEERIKQPLAGSVFVIENIGCKGLPTTLFKD